MAKSFGKVCPWRTMWRGWHKSMRSRERLQIHQEKNSVEHGDVVFLKESEVSDPWNHDCDGHYRCYKKDIRDDYIEDMNIILAGRICPNRYSNMFLDIFEKINNTPGTGNSGRFGERHCFFEWLNQKEAESIIRKWKGDSFGVLPFLVRHGLIEKSVLKEMKLRTKK